MTRSYSQALGGSCARFIGAAVLALGLLGAPAHAAGGLAPHKAAYSLRLHASSEAPDVVAVKGRMEVTVEASCDGWRVEQYLGFHLLTADGADLEHISRLSAFEGLDGREYVFSTQTWEDRQLVEEIGGVARRDPATASAQVRYAKPQPRSVALPSDIVFPTEHVKQLIAAARRGAGRVRHLVFDGSSRDDPFEISSYIGSLREGGAELPAALVGRAVWPLRLAYFKLGAVAPAPEFEMSVALYDNGVAGDMVYDYGEFAIDVGLQSVDLLPQPSCR